MEMEERRAAARIQVSLVGTITVEGQEPIKVYARDVSQEGAYLWGGVAPSVGDQVRVDLHSASELHQFQFSLEAVGTVGRVDPPEESKYGFAVDFEEILDSSRGD